MVSERGLKLSGGESQLNGRPAPRNKAKVPLPPRYADEVQSMLIRLLPKRKSAIILALWAPSFHFQHRYRTLCGFFQTTQRVLRTWRRSGGPMASSVSTVSGMVIRADSRIDLPSCSDVAAVSVTRHSRQARSCSARTRQSRSGFGLHTLFRAKRQE